MPDKITSEQLEAWERLGKEATPGPYWYDYSGAMIFTNREPEGDCLIADIRGFGSNLAMDANGKFIVTACNEFDSLITRVRELERENVALKSQLSKSVVKLVVEQCSDRSEMPPLPFSDKVSDSMRGKSVNIKLGYEYGDDGDMRIVKEPN